MAMKLPLSLLGVFLVFAAFLGIDPYDRMDWVLENVLVVLGLAFLGFSYRRVPLSRTSYVLIFVFLMIHEVGSHYTYAEVPYDAWMERWTGHSISGRFGFERNHYDRLVHFTYGLLLAYPFRELFVCIADVRGFWSYFLPLDFVMSSSMLYELVEWGAASVVGEGLGMAYLGTQGDVWDAHKDMALASLGALVGLVLVALARRVSAGSPASRAA